MSVSQSNSTHTTEKPVVDCERTRRTSVAPLSEVSIGKVTSRSTSSAAIPCASVMTTTVGAFEVGEYVHFHARGGPYAGDGDEDRRDNHHQAVIEREPDYPVQHGRAELVGMSVGNGVRCGGHLHIDGAAGDDAFASLQSAQDFDVHSVVAAAPYLLAAVTVGVELNVNVVESLLFGQGREGNRKRRLRVPGRAALHRHRLRRGNVLRHRTRRPRERGRSLPE